MFDGQVARFYPGATDSSPNTIFSDIYALDRTSKLHEYLNDFDSFGAGDWTITGAGSQVLTAGDGGQLAITSPVSAFQSLQKNPANFQLVQGYRSWFKTIAKLDSLLGNTLTGLLNITATPFTGASQTDGIWFTTDVTTGEVRGNVGTAGVIQTVDLGVQIIAGQFYQLAYYYEGNVYSLAPNGKVIFEVTTAPTSLVPAVTAPARAEISPGAGFPGATLLAPTLAVNASTAVARVYTVDLFYASKDRTNINMTPPF